MCLRQGTTGCAYTDPVLPTRTTRLLPAQLLLRQYVIKFKKSGTRTPRVELSEMGPRLDLSVRRHRPPPHEVEKEAMKQPQLGKKKVGAFFQVWFHLLRVYSDRGQVIVCLAWSVLHGMKRGMPTRWRHVQ